MWENKDKDIFYVDQVSDSFLLVSSFEDFGVCSYVQEHSVGSEAAPSVVNAKSFHLY